MDDREVALFLGEERTVVCATIGRNGWPHLMPLWYVLRPGETIPEVWAWTYAASQKTRNLERDSRATLQVEAGESYDVLRGVMLECETIIHRDQETIVPLGLQILTRYSSPRGQPPPTEPPAEIASIVAAQAGKRVALQFRARRIASWDHRKLGGVY
jgi:Pyridoxamine 5'-phosphate oxidase